MWTQIVGKTRLALTPLENHWWNVPLYVTPRGLTTSAIPCGPARSRSTSISSRINCCFTDQRGQGSIRMRLYPALGCRFLRGIYGGAASLGIEVHIYRVPWNSTT